MQDDKAVRNPGKDTFRINRCNIEELQIRGNQRGFLLADPLIQAYKKLWCREGVGQLCTQIIDDEQITIEDIAVTFCCLRFSGKGFLSQQFKQVVSGKINYGVTGIQQLFCDAVGQKSFADAGVTEKQQILKGIIKGIYKTMALNYGVSGSLDRKSVV